MAKREKDKYHDRTWLNPEKGRASIECSLELNRNEHWVSLDATVEISDCSRSVTLEFGAYDEKQAVEMVAKIRRLVTRLKLFETALVAFAGQVREDKR